MERISFEKLKKREPKKSEVAEIVNAYCTARGIETAIRFSKELKREFPYSRMAARAKQLLELCGGKLEDALYMVSVRNYWL